MHARNRRDRRRRRRGGRGASGLAAAASTVAAVLAAPSPAWAAMADERITQVLENARLWLVGIAATLVAVMLTIAGIRYLLGGGDPGESEKAKTALRAAAIGFAIILLAPVLVAILQGILDVE